MKNIKIIYLLSLTLSLQITQAEIIKHNEPTELEKKFEEKAKLIQEGHVNLINVIFQEAPAYTLKLQSAFQKVQKILLEFNTEIKTKKLINKEDEKILIAQLKIDILKPVEQLAPLLHKKGYRFLNEPLFIELSLEEETKEAIKTKIKKSNLSLDDIYQNIEENQIPLALKFLKSDEKTSQSFFSDFIVDRETLIETCKELEKLLGPLNKILTDQTKQKAIEFYKNLVAKNHK